MKRGNESFPLVVKLRNPPDVDSGSSWLVFIGLMVVALCWQVAQTTEAIDRQTCVLACLDDAECIAACVEVTRG